MSLAYEKYNSLCEKSIELFCIGSYAVRLEGGNFFELYGWNFPRGRST